MKIFQKYKLTELIDGLYNLKSSYLKSKNKGIEELVSEDLLKIHDEIVNEIRDTIFYSGVRWKLLL